MSKNVTRISIKVEYGNVNKAISKFKSKVTSEGIIKSVKDRRYYVQPSLARNLKRKKAEAQRRKDEINIIHQYYAEQEEWNRRYCRTIDGLTRTGMPFGARVRPKI